MVEVVATDEFAIWYGGLNDEDSKKVMRVVDLLEQLGVALPHPYSSAIKGTRYAFRELRASNPPLRIFYAFDPKRDAVLLIGGDKTGNPRFYDEMVAKAERIWEQYLSEQKEELP